MVNTKEILELAISRYDLLWTQGDNPTFEDCIRKAFEIYCPRDQNIIVNDEASTAGPYMQYWKIEEDSRLC